MALTYEQYRATSYFRALDGLRAISILLVLVLHVNSQLWARVNGGVGVYVFFVISGFLITTLAVREEEKRGALSLRAFYIRRSCRIFPLYYLVLAFYVLLVIGLDYHGHRDELLAGLPWYLSYLNDFTPNLDALPFAHSWSLGVEEKFYLAWPVLGFVAMRRGGAWRIGALAGLILAPFVLDRLGLLPFQPRLYGWPLYYAYAAILVGCLLALSLHHPRGYAWLSRFASGPLGVLAFVVAVAAHVLVSTADARLYFYPFAVALGMIPMLLGRPWWARLLESTPMVFIGIRCYGIYLVHLICLSVVWTFARRLPWVHMDGTNRPGGDTAWPASLMILALGFGGSLLLASLLHHVVEQPMIAVGRRFTRALTGADPLAPERVAAAHAAAAEPPAPRG